MAKSQAEYIEEQNRAAQAETEAQWKQREQQDAAYIAANNSAVDQSTAAALKPYETQMEQLPEEYRKQYDYNAVEELVRQKQVAETMANLGLTDSGLNRTQQTAIAIQRGNADAAARLSQQEKTQELQDKMDQLKASGEIEKQQTAAEVKANSQAWYNNLQNAAYENAVNRGTALYEAEQQRLADAAALQKQLEWQREQEEKQAARYSDMMNVTKDAKEAYQKKGKSGLEEFLFLQVASGVLSDEQAISLYEALENTPLPDDSWKGNIMIPSEFTKRKNAGADSLKDYANYDEYYKAMEKKYAGK